MWVPIEAVIGWQPAVSSAQKYRSRALQRPKARYPPAESSRPAPCPAPCWSYLAATFSGGVGQAAQGGRRDPGRRRPARGRRHCAVRDGEFV